MKPGTTKSARTLWLVYAAMLLSACDGRNEATQVGYRGTGLASITDPEDTAGLAAKNTIPEPIGSASFDGPKSSEVFKNVRVLGDTSTVELTRLMTAMTQWVAPKEGCVYCHLAQDYASDALYTKVVARRMLKMTRHINSRWKKHVRDTGVTCYTCHRGNPVPEYLWFAGSDIPEPTGMARSREGQNLGTSQITPSSLPYDPFSTLLKEDGEVRIISETALPTGKSGARTNAVGPRNATEQTYALMIHMSEALGVNCSYCHNSRAFWSWEQSSPARVRAWYGIRMARDLNSEYLEPLEHVFPAKRLGPNGDGPKLFCATCHQGVAKPLYGKSMLSGFPSLRQTIKK